MDAFLDGEAEATEQLQTGGEDTSSAAVRSPYSPAPLPHTAPRLTRTTTHNTQP